MKRILLITMTILGFTLAIALASRLVEGDCCCCGEGCDLDDLDLDSEE